MQLPNNEQTQKEIILKASLLLIGIALSALEFFIPRIPLLPWLKPGLANVITLIWIIQFGFVESLLYALLRIWIVSFYFGFSFFTFSLGFSEAVCACIAMSVCWKVLGKRSIMGTVGIAVIGAIFHNMGQLFAVYLLMAQNSRLFFQIPIMLIASVIFGGFVGLIAPILLRMISDGTILQRAEGADISYDIRNVHMVHLIISFAFLGLCMALVFVSHLGILITIAVFVTFFIQGIIPGSVHALLYPVRRFWLLFIFVGILHGFFTYGTKISYFPFVTYEGINQAVIQWLRLWTWLETTFIFIHFRFHMVVLKGLQKVFTGNRSTLYAGLLAVEYFPSIVELVQQKSGTLLRALFKNPSHVISELFNNVVDTIIAENERSAKTIY